VTDCKINANWFSLLVSCMVVTFSSLSCQQEYDHKEVLYKYRAKGQSLPKRVYNLKKKFTLKM